MNLSTKYWVVDAAIICFGTFWSQRIVKCPKLWTYLYKLGASLEDECPPKIQTFPTTNHIAKKQSNAILNLSTRVPTLLHNNSMSVVISPTLDKSRTDLDNNRSLSNKNGKKDNTSQTKWHQASRKTAAKEGTENSICLAIQGQCLFKNSISLFLLHAHPIKACNQTSTLTGHNFSYFGFLHTSDQKQMCNKWWSNLKNVHFQYESDSQKLKRSYIQDWPMHPYKHKKETRPWNKFRYLFSLPGSWPSKPVCLSPWDSSSCDPGVNET